MKEHNLFHETCMTYLDEEERGANVVDGVMYITPAATLLQGMADAETLDRVLKTMRAERKAEKERI